MLYKDHVQIVMCSNLEKTASLIQRKTQTMAKPFLESPHRSGVTVFAIVWPDSISFRPYCEDDAISMVFQRKIDSLRIEHSVPCHCGEHSSAPVCLAYQMRYYRNTDTFKITRFYSGATKACLPSVWLSHRKLFCRRFPTGCFPKESILQEASL